MTSNVDWIVVAGFLLAALGVSLRIFIMMRSSDSYPINAAPTGGRGLVRAYITTFPKSRLPLAMWISLSAGLVLLIAGLLREFR